jgi:hypothetical protein
MVVRYKREISSGFMLMLVREKLCQAREQRVLNLGLVRMQR